MSAVELITKNLNPEQRRAVETIDGPLLILAGAGSGKTRVLTHRMANIIAQRKAAADEILCVTFTNKAAKEMESRIFSLLSDIGIHIREPLWVSTFHSFCVRILRQNITLLDYKQYFAIYDDSDQLSQIKKVCNALNLNEKTHPAKNFKFRINEAKQLGITSDQVENSHLIHFDEKSVQVYKMYEEEMKKANALDFGDLLLKTYDLFRMYPDILEMYQQKFKYIMVDEYQDTNHIQYLLVQLLAKSHRNLCVVGDEDQSIYSWRGADIKNILDFEKDFTEAAVVKLEENYRSTKNIVTAATFLIKNNTERKDKTLFTSNPEGDPISIREERNEYDEAKFVVKSITSMINDGDGNHSDYAIFYRTNAQSRVLEEQLRFQSIPYKIVGGIRFYERMEIKDVLGYLKLAINPQDDVAFKRVINVPARGIGKTTVERLEAISIEQKVPMMQAAAWAIDNRAFNAGTSSKIRNFLLLINDIQEDAKNHELLDFYGIVLDKTGYLAALKKEDTPEAEARLENLEELSNAMAQFQKERDKSTLQDFLEEMALVSDVDQYDANVNTVTLMTLHISKGLEFPYVFIVGMEENLFPSDMSDGDDPSEIEEERRLAYVGMTRARQKLFLTYARTRKVWGQEQFNPPSRFLKEIPKELVQMSTTMEMPKFVQKYQHTSTGTNRSRSFESDSQDFPDYENEYSSKKPGFNKGERVRHPTFGAGTIYNTEGNGDEQKVSVMFSDHTIKKFVAKYARLERV